MMKYEKIGMDEKGNAVFETIENGQVVQVLKPEDKNLWKSREFYIIFSRTALNPRTLQNVSGWFIQRLLFRVPNRDGFDYHYFTKPKGVNLPHIRILDSRMGRLCGLCFSVNVSDKDYVRKLGAPKRISTTQKYQILKTGMYEGLEVLGQFSESGEEWVQPKSS
jgi:hypothetical protein